MNWISVNISVPTTSEKVLVFVKKDLITIARFDPLVGSWRMNGDFVLDGVIDWMPLPDIPIEEEGK